jgi:hypothetical protein
VVLKNSSYDHDLPCEFKTRIVVGTSTMFIMYVINDQTHFLSCPV